MLWPLSSVLLLVVLEVFLVSPIIFSLYADVYTSSLDKNFWITAVVIIAGHVIALGTVPLILNKRGFFNSTKRIKFFAIFGVFTVLLQGLFRVINDSLSRLDCGNDCVDSVMASSVGSILNVLTFVSLFLVLIVFYVLLRKKLIILK